MSGKIKMYKKCHIRDRKRQPVSETKINNNVAEIDDLDTLYNITAEENHGLHRSNPSMSGANSSSPGV